MFELRPFQIEAIQALRDRGHVLCVAPTGSGKSRIFQEISLRPGMRTLLVSPLVALGRQHAERAAAVGLRVIEKGEEPSSGSGIRICSPESLQYPGFLNWIAKWRPNFLVVDECHCVHEWGEGFRPAFRMLPGLVRRFGIESSLWITATMPEVARRALDQALEGRLKTLGRFALPENLFLATVRVPRSERLLFLRQWIRERKGAGIVFVTTRGVTHRFSEFLGGPGRVSVPYHAGMSAEERLALERKIRDREADLIVATSAFGLGMDHSHLEWAVQWQAPSSLLSLAQAMGRAGRDPRKRAQALVLWDADDFRMLEWMLGRSAGKRAELVAVKHFLEAQGCRRAELARYFGESNFPLSCASCNTCGALSDGAAA